jgi:hypothetical protein
VRLDMAVPEERGQEAELRVSAARAALGSSGTGGHGGSGRTGGASVDAGAADAAVWTPAIVQKVIAARAGERGRSENAPATRSATQPPSAPRPTRCAAARRLVRCPTSASLRASASADDSDRTKGIEARGIARLLLVIALVATGCGSSPTGQGNGGRDGGASGGSGGVGGNGVATRAGAAAAAAWASPARAAAFNVRVSFWKVAVGATRWASCAFSRGKRRSLARVCPAMVDRRGSAIPELRLARPWNLGRDRCVRRRSFPP